MQFPSLKNRHSSFCTAGGAAISPSSGDSREEAGVGQRCRDTGGGGGAAEAEECEDAADFEIFAAAPSLGGALKPGGGGPLGFGGGDVESVTTCDDCAAVGAGAEATGGADLEFSGATGATGPTALLAFATAAGGGAEGGGTENVRKFSDFAHNSINVSSNGRTLPCGL